MEQYSIGRVFSRAFDQLKSNFWTLLGFVILSYLLTSVITVIAAIPLFASIGVNAAALAAGGAAHDPSAMLGLIAAPSFWLALLVLITVALLSYSVIYAGAFYCLGASSIGETPSIGSCFGVGFRKAFPLFLTMLLGGLGVMLGYLLLIIPGIILALMWAVAIPACVLENLGATASLQRSNELTKGSKGMIFLTFLVVTIGMLVLELLIFGIFGMSMTAMVTPGTQPSPANIGGAIAGILFGELVLVVFGMLVMLVMLSLHVSIYREVKLVREGSDSGLADVFR